MQVREGCFVLIVIVLSLVLLCVVCDWTCLAFVAYLDRRFKWGRRRFLLSRHMLFVGDEAEGLGGVDVEVELSTISGVCIWSRVGS